MKERIRKYSFIIIIIELLWIWLALTTFFNFYNMLDISNADELIDVARYYSFLGFENVPESVVNTIISYSVLILGITVPLVIFNYKNHNSVIKKGKYERSTGIYHLIAGILSILALNIPTAVLYFLSSKQILKEKPKEIITYEDEEFADGEKNALSLLKIFGSTFFLVFFALVIIIPFYWMILTALMSKATFQDFTQLKLFLPFREMNWINFKEALEAADFGRYISNTVFVALVTTAGTIFTTILAAFAFSRLEFFGRDFIFSLLIMTMMVPGELYVITNFVTISNFGWYDTFNALIFPFIVDIFYIFFLRQAFKQIPDSLYRAAKVDGCSDFKFLLRVMIPVALPTLITITILSALGTWNAYVWPSLVTEEQHYLVSIALRRGFVDADTGIPDYRLQMAAAAIVTVPILIIFLFARKYIMRGVGRSGTKG